MPAFIFLCDLTTEQECRNRKLFGSNPGDAHRFHYSNVAVADTLFLYNFDTGFLRGPYSATTRCMSNIEPDAWKKTRRSFPWQVRVDDARVFERLLGVDVISKIVPVTAGKIGILPPYELTDDQAAEIIAAFERVNATA